MKNPKHINTILGWLVFLIASTVYIITCEPTASFWDPGEYIATAYKLQVGHPPGAPFFQLMGRFFSLFAFGDVQLVARLINIMSALFSGATIMFLFWTVTALARKIFSANGKEISGGNLWAIWGAALVGSLAFTFSDSFWFSAVEGEVYATSSFFTAIVFWAILKWEAVADDDQSWRWIILIAFLMGLSIGVHLLNLLAIPAITFVFYFRKFKHSIAGFSVTLVISLLLLAAIMYGIIPQAVALFARTELIFVNTFGMPFNSGTVFFALLILALIISGLYYTYRPGKISGTVSMALFVLLAALVLTTGHSAGGIVIRLLVCAALAVLLYLGCRHYAMLKTAILSIAFILIGYSTFLALVIRANADPPINENSPKDAISLLSYLNREQYGTWPLWYGQYFNAPYDAEEPFIDGKPVYGRNDSLGRYVIIDSARKSIPNYDDRFCTVFPRMWSSQQSYHESGYRSWGQVKGEAVTVTTYYGQPQTLTKPTFGENLRFFTGYQLGFMYFRYFMWNFSGRQNDLQGYGNNLNGNWISGIGFIDKMRLGPQSDLPDHMAGNKGRNVFYMLPLILGLAGFLFHVNKRSRDAFIVFLLFLFTGIAINVYLNIVPYQPRERDYAYAASFYAFAIWIGIGVLPLFKLLQKWLREKIAAITATLLCLLLVPAIMAIEGWDDHDRSGRYTPVDIAANYLNSCAPDAVLLTLGDNDTFPLWYAQEVEGIRTDVRVINLNLLNADWYIHQMRKKAYDSEPLQLTIPPEKYMASNREIVYIYEDTANAKAGTYIDLKQAVAFALSDNPDKKLNTFRGLQNYIPTANFSIPIDSALISGSDWIPEEYRDSVFSQIKWKYGDYAIQKNILIMMDFLAHFGWKRPVYLALPTEGNVFPGLQDHLRLEGLAYRLVPYRCRSIDGMTGQVYTPVMFDNLMNKFRWRSLDDPDVYLDEINMRNIENLRELFARLAAALLHENKPGSAIQVCDKCLAVMPHGCIPYDKTLVPIAEIYFSTGEKIKASNLCRLLVERYEQELIYFSRFTGVDAAYVEINKNEALEVIGSIAAMTEEFNDKELNGRAQKILSAYAR